jgi:hypothetical protein
MMRSLSNRLIATMRRVVEWGDRRVPTGLRSVVGLLLMAGGALGFLPVLGFWMLPVGLAFIALDIPPLRRRLLAWLKRRDVRSPGHSPCPSGRRVFGRQPADAQPSRTKTGNAN